MVPSITLGQRTPGTPCVVRRAVKAVTVIDGCLLLMRASRSGAVKFPGGGLEPGEGPERALRRELLEECGVELLAYGDVVLSVVEVRPDVSAPGRDFRMESSYVACEVGPQRGRRALEPYERDLGLAPVWVPADTAWQAQALLRGSTDAPSWVEREYRVLEWLLVHGRVPRPTTEP